jgi:hypothetical protein
MKWETYHDIVQMIPPVTRLDGTPMNFLVYAVIAIAIAQVLTILLSIGREREIKKLRELVTEHRIQIAEIKAWLAGRIQSAQPRRIKPDREPIREPIADDMRVPEPAITPKDLADAIRPSTTKDELKRATKAFKWFKEDADEPREIVEAREIVAGLKGRAPPEPAITPKDLPDAIRPSTTKDELKRATKVINSLKEDADKVRLIVAGQQDTPPGHEK